MTTVDDDVDNVMSYVDSVMGCGGEETSSRNEKTWSSVDR